MNGPGDLPLQHYSATPDTNNCSIISIIPTLGMSSCRGRAEAFARRLSSKLRTLGSQADDSDHSQEDEPIINGDTPNNTWVTGHEAEQAVTDLQPLRHESDSFFDFDCELESPGSPADECEYLRLIESTSNTPHNSAAESGYACASAASSQSSSDGPYFDVNSENESSQQIQQQKHHICQPHHIERDEVDYNKVATAKAAASANVVHSGLCNGHVSPVLTERPPPTPPSSPIQTSSESQHIAHDVTKALPGEGPDIEANSHKTEATAIKENGMMDSLQEQILKELQKQSEDVTAEEAENKKNLQTEPVTATGTETEPVAETETETERETVAEAETESETVTETETETVTEASVKENEENLYKVIHTLINGHAENGEDVLKIEVCEMKQSEELPKECLIAEAEAETPQVPTETTETPKPINTQEQLLSTSHLDTTDDEDDCRPQRVRRCSSLKTGKTPPGTPGRKKIVRFADVLGLDLADIKTFLDEIPTIPKSAYEDLEILESEPPVQMGPKSDKLLMPLFQQPAGLAKFLDTVREKQVSLENAAVTDNINHTITGSVRVRNLDFHKSVHIRYSLDGWRSYADLQANYVENTCDGFSDKFSFVLFGNSLHVGQRLEFAVRFQCKGQQYWDNNHGSNYCFQCLPTSMAPRAAQQIPSHHANNMVGILSPTAGEAWCTSFY